MTNLLLYLIRFLHQTTTPVVFLGNFQEVTRSSRFTKWTPSSLRSGYDAIFPFLPRQIY